MKQKTACFIITLLLACLLAVPPSVVVAQDSPIEEVRDILQLYYMDELDEEVLNSPTIEEMIKKIGDPDTEYMTKAQYQAFMASIENESLVGVGITTRMTEQGLLVETVLNGYSAQEQGLLPDDVIIAVDTKHLAGLTLQQGVDLLRGVEGSAVNVQVLRDSYVLDFTLTRQPISLPLVEGEVLEDHIGYLAINSFGDHTDEEFHATVQDLLTKGADCWLIDLRNNGGGYTDAALNLLGYFIGEQKAMILESRGETEDLDSVGKAYRLSGPVILLTNEYTASASEIMTGALKDYKAALVIGNVTYGSGKVKMLLELNNGDFLKFSLYRFYSPLHGNINEVGIAPHLSAANGSALLAGLLLLKQKDQADLLRFQGDKSGYYKVQSPAGEYVFAQEDLWEEYWLAGQILLGELDATFIIEKGTETGWQPLPWTTWLNKERFYYGGFQNFGHLEDVPADKVFRLNAVGVDVDWHALDSAKVELIDAQTGRRLDYTLEIASERQVQLKPVDLLYEDREYWLVINGLKDKQGMDVPAGIAVIRTSASE